MILLNINAEKCQKFALKCAPSAPFCANLQRWGCFRGKGANPLPSQKDKMVQRISKITISPPKSLIGNPGPVIEIDEEDLL